MYIHFNDDEANNNKIYLFEWPSDVVVHKFMIHYYIHGIIALFLFFPHCFGWTSC